MKIERLDKLIDYACEICDAPDHRNQSAAVVVQWIMRSAQAKSELELLLAGLTTEDRMALRDEITREIEEQFVISQTADLESKRQKAEEQICRLKERWALISKFGGIVPTEINGRDLLDEITRTIRSSLLSARMKHEPALWTCTRTPCRMGSSTTPLAC